MRNSHQDILVALTGQPNSGKSTVFQHLTGVHQQVANYAGVTVEKKSGHYHEHFEWDQQEERYIADDHQTLQTDDAHDDHSHDSGRSTHTHFSGNRRVELVDLPGTYSLTSYTQEERVSRDFLLLQSPEVVVVIVDASNLHRHLFFVFQLLELQLPTVVCLNMIDVAKRRGINVDADKLSQLLGVPVVPTNGAIGEGIEDLRRAIHHSVHPAGHEFNDWKLNYDESFEEVVTSLEAELKTRRHLTEDFSARWLAVKLLENDFDARRIVQHHTHEDNWAELLVFAEKLYKRYEAEHNSTPQKSIALARSHFASYVESECVKRDPNRRYHKSDRIDRFLCHPILGPALLVTIMFLAFQLTFSLSNGWTWFPNYTQQEDATWGWQVGTPVEFVETVFDVWLPALLEPILQLDKNGPMYSLLFEGIISGVGGVIVFVPVIFFMFLILSILEQTGYIARVAMLLDRIMRLFGLQGQSIMPMILAGGISGGCAVPAVMTTRNMKDQRERILTILVIPFMNCGAKMPVYALLVAAFFSAWQGIIFGSLILISWGLALLAARLLSMTFVRGKASSFLLELPPYQLPRFKDIFNTACMQSWWFLKKAGTIILAVNVFLWCLMYYPQSNTMLKSEQRANSYAGQIGRVFEPVSKYAGFDWRDNIALIGGFVAKEVIISCYETLYQLEDDSETVTAVADVKKTESASTANAALQEQANVTVPLEALALPETSSEKQIETQTTDESGEPIDEEELAHLRLGEKLHATPGWNGVKAYAMMLFVMIYAPCTATCVVVYQETRHIKWVAITILFNTVVAFLVAVLVYQVGNWFL